MFHTFFLSLNVFSLLHISLDKSAPPHLSVMLLKLRPEGGGSIRPPR